METLQGISLPTRPSETDTPQFYRLDGSKLTCAEYFRANPLLIAAIASGARLLGIPLKVEIPPMPRLRSMKESTRGLSTIPEAVRGRLEALVNEFGNLGFEAPWVLSLHHEFRPEAGFTVTMRHSSGQAFARINLVKGVKEMIEAGVCTALEDGRILGVKTLAGGGGLRMPRNFHVKRFKAASPGKLWSVHQQSLTGERTHSMPIGSDADLHAIVDRLEDEVWQLWIDSGLFVAVTPAELDAARALLPEKTIDLGEVPPAHVPILVELKKIGKPDRNWKKTLRVFLVTLALFAVVGFARWHDATLLFCLLGVLLFHEAGHYFAMLLFGYKNVRVFFIPFLGALATGENLLVPAWKKAIMLLMGPLPGMIVASFLIAGTLHATPPDWLMTTLIVLLSLNGFNLLPLVPLDGGQFIVL